MTTFPAVDRQIIDIAPPQWCWSHLSESAEGILSYRASRGTVALAVPYTITDQQVTIPVAPFNDAAWLAAGGEATLEVAGSNGDGLRWVVRASGPVRRSGRMSPISREFARLSHPANRPGEGLKSSWVGLVLQTARIRGFYMTSLEPADDSADQQTAQFSAIGGSHRTAVHRHSSNPERDSPRGATYVEPNAGR